jgi:hypothetical protein
MDAVTSGAPRTLRDKPAFLGHGDRLADLCTDGPRREDREPDPGGHRGHRADPDLARNGGFPARICPAVPGRNTCGS